jgi:pimeloyl-ACP methyl ester carboxylesterase
VIEAGATATRLGARRVQYALGSETRVCTYDRPGTGGAAPSASDPRPPGVGATSETFARELRTLLTNANVPGPYVLAGASFGGFLISTYTARYPEDVAGLVFVDALAPGSAEGYLRQGALLEPWDGSADLDRLRALSFGARPLVVLVTQMPSEVADLRRRSSNILVAEAPQYSHFVFLDTPGLAYEAIRVAVASVRSGGQLPRCAQTPLARIVARCSP